MGLINKLKWTPNDFEGPSSHFAGNSGSVCTLNFVFAMSPLEKARIKIV